MKGNRNLSEAVNLKAALKDKGSGKGQEVEVQPKEAGVRCAPGHRTIFSVGERYF